MAKKDDIKGRVHKLRGKENCSQGRRRIVKGIGWSKYCKKIGNEDESKGRGSKGRGLLRKRIA
jgi:hypothetical protein